MARRRDYVLGLVNRLRSGFERALGARAGSFLRRQGVALGGLFPDEGLQGIGVRLSADSQDLARILRVSYSAAGDASLTQRLRMLGLERPPKFLNEEVLDFAVRRSGEQVVGINRATARYIGRIVKAHAELGSPVREVARAIEEGLVGASHARAFQIARTEVSTATSWADHLAAKESGLRLVKVWLTAQDGGARHPSEPGLEGQVRDMDDAFDVRGFALMFPSDPAGPASEVVSCRCTCDFRPRGKA